MKEEREYNFAVEMWVPKKTELQPLKVALIGLGAVGMALGIGVVYKGLIGRTQTLSEVRS